MTTDTSTPATGTSSSEPALEASQAPLFYMPLITAAEIGIRQTTFLMDMNPSKMRLSIDSYLEPLDIYSMSTGLLFYAEDPIDEEETQPKVTLSLCLGPVEQYSAYTPSKGQFPTPAFIIYRNLDKTAVQVALEPLFNKQPTAALKLVWKETPPPDSNPDEQRTEVLVANFKQRFFNISSSISLAVKGGDCLGKLLVRSESQPEKNRLTLEFYTVDGIALSPLFCLKYFSVLDNNRWRHHPLFEEMDKEYATTLHLEIDQWQKGVEAKLIIQGVSTEYSPEIPEDGKIIFTLPTSEFFSPTLETVKLKAKIQGNSGLLADYVSWDQNAFQNQLVAEIQGTFPYTQIGNPSVPLILPLGFEFVVCFKAYLHNDSTKSPFNAPRGMFVKVIKEGDRGNPLIRKTNEAGEIRLTLLDFMKGDQISFEISSEIDYLADFVSNTPDRPRAIFIDVTDMNQPSKPLIWKSEIISPGQVINPFSFILDGEFAEALYILKALRDLSVFLFHITGREWQGFSETLEIAPIREPNPLRSYSWPVGNVNLDQGDVWDRMTIIHEISHQILWQQANISSGDILEQFLPLMGDYINEHYHRKETSTLTAIYEGWADFIALIFNEREYNAYPFTDSTSDKMVHTKDGQSLHLISASPNTGERVEGAFAAALMHILQTHVFQTSPPYLFVVENLLGDIQNNNSWISNADYPERFKKLIWSPLQKLSEVSNDDDVTTTQMLKNMSTINEHEFLRIESELQNDFNMLHP